MANLAYAPNIAGQTGRLWSAIGWFNFASIPSVNTPFTTTLVNGIKGGGTITARFTLSRTSGVGPANFVAVNPPTWNGAAFGNTAYKSIGQPVCLRDLTDNIPNYGQIVVDNISIKNKYGEPVTAYDFYFTDSETPASGDQETFITNGTPWEIFYTLPNSGQGFATLTGVGTTIVKASGLGNVPILLTRNPTSITQTVTGGGAMSFGISLTIVEMRKVVTARLDPSDQFKLDIIGPNSATTTTVGTATGLQQQGLQVTSGLPGYFVFDESMASGSVSPLSYYTPTVQLSNQTTDGTTLPSTIALGSGVTLTYGDYAVMTVTNSPANTVVTLNKSVDKQYSGVGESLRYTLVVKNSSPYPVNNVVVTDTIPTNTSFIAGTLFLNGSQITGSPAPPTGVSVGTLQSGEAATITFNVQVASTIPAPNRAVNNSTATFTPRINIGSVNSQTVVTTINGAVVTSTKSTNKAYANIGDTISYTIVIKNTGNVTANNIVFADTIPSGTSLISNTFKQDTTLITGTPNPPGVTLPNNLGVNQTTTITFQVKVDTIPNPNPIPNTATAIYSFTVNPSIPNGTSSASNTNTVNTQVNNASLSGIRKYTDKSYATCGDIVNYTIEIPNSGNVTAQNVIFKDTIPNGTTFVTDSVYINGSQSIGANPNSGFSVSNIAPGSTTTITFSVKVQC